MNILVFPKATNPYEELLYRQMSKLPDFHFRYITFRITQYTVLNCLLFPLLLIRKRMQKFSLIHIHWLYEFSTVRNGLFTRLFFTGYVLWILVLIKLTGYTLVYTIHDSLARDHQFLFEKALTAAIILLSDHIICLSGSTVQELASMHIPVPRRKISLIPHGSYTGWYDNSIGIRKARRILDVPVSSFVLLYFGFIRQYKGVQDLLVCLEKIIRQHNMVIVLAGVCDDRQIESEINAFHKLYPSQSRLDLKHIPDNEVQIYFNACDSAVFPFRHITNSGSVFLAASFKKPFIAPTAGCIRDFPKDSGIFYDPSDPDGLATSIETAIRIKQVLPEYGLKGYHYVNSTSWPQIAEKTMNIYQHYDHR